MTLKYFFLGVVVLPGCTLVNHMCGVSTEASIGWLSDPLELELQSLVS